MIGPVCRSGPVCRGVIPSPRDAAAGGFGSPAAGVGRVFTFPARRQEGGGRSPSPPFFFPYADPLPEGGERGAVTQRGSMHRTRRRRWPSLPGRIRVAVRREGSIHILEIASRLSAARPRPCRPITAQPAIAHGRIWAGARMPGMEIFIDVPPDDLTHFIPRESRSAVWRDRPEHDHGHNTCPQQ